MPSFSGDGLEEQRALHLLERPARASPRAGGMKSRFRRRGSMPGAGHLAQRALQHGVDGALHHGLGHLEGVALDQGLDEGLALLALRPCCACACSRSARIFVAQLLERLRARSLLGELVVELGDDLLLQPLEVELEAGRLALAPPPPGSRPGRRSRSPWCRPPSRPRAAAMLDSTSSPGAISTVTPSALLPGKGCAVDGGLVVHAGEVAGWRHVAALHGLQPARALAHASAAARPPRRRHGWRPALGSGRPW